MSGAVPVRGVLFDVDDTLVDTASAFGAALRISVGALAPLSDADAELLLRTWRADAGGHYREYVAGRLSFGEQRRRRLAELTRLLGLADLDDEEFAAWDAAYQRSFEEGWAAFDDGHEAVAAAREAGLAVGVVTNAAARMQRRKLSAVGLSDLGSSMVANDTLGVGKPDPRVFHEGCRIIGTAPEATIYVGDELDIDAGAAVGAGLRGVWLDRPGRRRGGPHEVTPERLERAREAGVRVITSLRQLRPLWA